MPIPSLTVLIFKACSELPTACCQTAHITTTLSSTRPPTSSSRTMTSILTSDASCCSTSRLVYTTTCGLSTNSRSSTALVVILANYRAARSLTKLLLGGLLRRPRSIPTLTMKAYSECCSTMCLTAITSSLAETPARVTPENSSKPNTSDRSVA